MSSITVHVVDANGELQRSITALDMATIELNVGPAESWVPHEPPAAPAWWNGAAWVLRGAAPDDYHDWDAAAHAWRARSTGLAEAKAAKRLEMLQARNAAERGTFLCDGLRFDSNKANVTGAVSAALMAQLAGATFEQAWTLADNSVLLLDGPAVLRLGAAQVAYTGAVYATYRSLADRVESATSTDDVSLVTWPT